MRHASWDPVLNATKRNTAWVGGVLVVLALVVPFGMAPHDYVLTPLLIWGLGVLPLAIRQSRRPLDPFCHSDLGPIRTLSAAQARALTYLTHGPARRIGWWTAGAVGLLILLAVCGGRSLGQPYVLLLNYARWPLYQQALVSVLASLLAGGLLMVAVIMIILSISAGCLLRRWPWIQAHCEPWPIDRKLGRHFSCVARSADLAAIRSMPGIGEPLDEFSRPITWRQGVATVCSFVGWIGFVGSSVQLFDLVADPAGHSRFPPGAALRMSVVPVVFLAMLLIARYLRQSE